MYRAIAVSMALIGCLAGCNANRAARPPLTGVPIVVYVDQDDQLMGTVAAGGSAWVRVTIDNGSASTVVLGHLEMPDAVGEQLVEDGCQRCSVSAGGRTLVKVNTLHAGQVRTWGVRLENGNVSSSAAQLLITP